MKNIISWTIATVLLFSAVTPHVFASEVGTQCSIKGQQSYVGNVKLQCVERNQKLIWTKKPKILAPDTLKGSITVFAASSLRNAFDSIAKKFQQAHPEVQIKFLYAGSNMLSYQIQNGAPADIFASASNRNMKPLLDNHLITESINFAYNKMVIVTPKKSLRKITHLRDLAQRNVKVAVCQIDVPCGSATFKVMQKSNIFVQPVTFEPNVGSVLTKVLLAEVDAGFVYVTDALVAHKQVNMIRIPKQFNTGTTYSIAQVRTNSKTSKEFLKFVLSDWGAGILATLGFVVL